jgi:NitT/TauT family transport system substrate-binding protein
MERWVRQLLIGAGTAAIGIALMAAPGTAQQLEKKKVVVAVGGVTSQIDKLPYAVALHKGYFKDEGLEVESIDFGSGAKGLQAMVGGSADVTQGAYEHTIRLQAKGVELTSMVVFARYPGNVLVIPKASADKIKSVADLKGKRIGISSPGSATHIFFALLLEKAGLKVDDCTYIALGNGPGAVAAMRKGGEIDALVNLDPNIAELERTGDVVVLADGRIHDGVQRVYGGDYVSSSLYAKRSFVLENPNTSQALANAIVRAMKFIAKSTPDEIMKSLPESYWQANPDFYKATLVKNLGGFTFDGLMPSDVPARVHKVISAFEEDVRNAKVDLSKTYDNKFAIKANEKYR